MQRLQMEIQRPNLGKLRHSYLVRLRSKESGANE